MICSNAWAFETKPQVLTGSPYKAQMSWEISSDKAFRSLKEIEINGKKIKVAGELLDADEEAEIEVVDLNQDKENDYAITLRRGVSNRYILYLLWDEATKSYISLGEMPELSFIEKSKCWTGFEKNNESKAVSLKVVGSKFVKCP
jgi:hypothetical protein